MGTGAVSTTSGPARRGRTALVRGLAVVAVTLAALAPTTIPAAPAAARHLPTAAASRPGPAATPAATEVAATSDVTIDSIAPLTVTPQDTVTLRATVHNSGAERIEAPTASLSIVRYRIQSRTQLRAWFADELALPQASPLTSVDLAEPLEPGESRPVELTLPAADLRLLPYPEASGPRGVVVDLSDRATGGVVASARSFLLWFPQGVVEAAQLSILVPVTGPPANPADPAAWGASLATATASGGPLNRVLAATAASRDVSWVVDPALVETTAAGVGGDVAVAWSSALLTAAQGREIFRVDPFDPDVAALARAGVGAFLQGENTSADPTVDGWRSDLALPVPGTAGEATLAAAAAAGDSLVVVAGTPEPTEPTAVTPSGVAAVSTPDGSVRALLPDAELSRLFSDATGANHQLLLAELAVIAQEQPGRSAHVLIATDRSWQPDEAATAAMLGVLGAAPFVDLQPVAALAGTQADTVVGAELGVESFDYPALSVAQLSRAQAQADDVAALASVVDDPEALVATYRRDLAAATSVAATGAPGLSAQLLQTATATGDALLRGISVLPGSTVNLINKSGAIPVTVRNDLTQPATVTVALSPAESRLSVDAVRVVTIAPGAAADVQVPVRAIGSGDVVVQVRVLAADGAAVAAPSQFTVRVRAGWETVGTAVIGAALALLLVGGIIRTARRGRSSRRMEPIRPSDAEPDAAEPDAERSGQPDAPEAP